MLLKADIWYSLVRCRIEGMQEMFVSIPYLAKHFAVAKCPPLVIYRRVVVLGFYLFPSKKVLGSPSKADVLGENGQISS